MQFLADVIESPVDRPKMLETTALGVAWLAGSHIQFYPNKVKFSKGRLRDKIFKPQMTNSKRNKLTEGWDLAIKRTLLK